MPEHETYDLEAAFARLQHDVADLSRPRGAGQAVARARRRRRTTVASAAAVAVLAAGAAVIGHGVGGRGSSVGPSDQPLPTPTTLSAAALSSATAGWVDGWAPPTDAQAASLDSMHCLGSSGGSESPLNHSTREGGAVFGAGSTEIAYVVALEFDAARIDAAGAAIAASATGCQPTATRTTTYAGGSQVTFYQLSARSGTGDVELWTARYGDRLALGVVGGTTDEPPADAVARIGDLLIGALQVDSTLTDRPSATVGGASSSASASASPEGFGTVAQSDFAAALGGWASGWKEHGTKSDANPLPCAGTWTSGSSSGTGSAVGANGEQDFYRFDSAGTAHASAAALVDNLRTCPSSPGTVTTVPWPGAMSVTVVTGGSPTSRVVWIVQLGTAVGYLTIPADALPPDQVSQRVAGLLGDALHGVSEGPPPVVSSSPAAPTR